MRVIDLPLESTDLVSEDAPKSLGTLESLWNQRAALDSQINWMGVTAKKRSPKVNWPIQPIHCPFLFGNIQYGEVVFVALQIGHRPRTDNTHDVHVSPSYLPLSTSSYLQGFSTSSPNLLTFLTQQAVSWASTARSLADTGNWGVMVNYS